jgi:hypothetical protein
MGIVPVGFKQAEKALAGIQNGYPKAMTDAINRALVAGRTAAAKAITAHYAIKSSALKEAGIELKKASWAKQEGGLVIKGHMLNVGRFTPSIRMSFGHQHVSVTIIKGQKKLIRGAFNTPKGVVIRTGQSRRPITGVVTIGASHMAGERHISEEIQRTIGKAVTTRLHHNVEYALGNLEKESAGVRQKAKQKFKEKEVGHSQ